MLLPAARAAAPETILVSDGFSCREQVQQGTPRTPLHLAELCKMALDEADAPTADALPERRYVTPPAPQSGLLLSVALALLAALVAALLLIWRR